PKPALYQVEVHPGARLRRGALVNNFLGPAPEPARGPHAEGPCAQKSAKGRCRPENASTEDPGEPGARGPRLGGRGLGEPAGRRWRSAVRTRARSECIAGI